MTPSFPSLQMSLMDDPLKHRPTTSCSFYKTEFKLLMTRKKKAHLVTCDTNLKASPFQSINQQTVIHMFTGIVVMVILEFLSTTESQVAGSSLFTSIIRISLRPCLRQNLFFRLTLKFLKPYHCSVFVSQTN